MVSWPFVRSAVRIATAIAFVYVSWVFLSRYWSNHHPAPAVRDEAQARRDADFARTYGGSDLKILQFYAREGNLTEGSPTVVCYGVLNARSVKIVPDVEPVTPSLSRCVEVSPAHDTVYTITAEGNDGKTLTESFALKVSADQETLPRITYFKVATHKVERGRHIYGLTFGAKNGLEISVDPPEFPTLHGAPNGQFFVAPEHTTTYTLTVTGKFGHKTQKSLTVEVPPGS